MAPIIFLIVLLKPFNLPRYHLKLWMGFPDESAAYLPA
jgi:hypothetical protein